MSSLSVSLRMVYLVRKDLDSQTTEEFNKFENGSVDATDRTDVLVKQMQDKNRLFVAHHLIDSFSDVNATPFQFHLNKRETIDEYCHIMTHW